MKINKCEVGHPKHDIIQVGAHLGPFDMILNTYDYEQYKDVKGYCTGKDDISRCLQQKGVWEADQTDLAVKILMQNTPNETVIDFGTHIGWYSLLAAKMGYRVRGFEADPENINTLLSNVKNNNLRDVDVALAWIDQDFPEIEFDRGVRLMKCDLEGNDDYAVRVCRKLFISQLIDYAMIEISPVFNDSYPHMVGWLQGLGYKVYIIGPTLKEFDGNFEFNQENFLFVRSGLKLP